MQPKFVHLRFHSEYSITDGIVRLNPAIKQMKEWGVGALGQTDLMNMFGSVRFYESCHKEGIKPILGCEVYVAPGSRFDRETSRGEDRYYHLVLLAENNTGYSNLMKIVSAGFIDGFYYKPRVDMEILEKYHEGIIALSA